MTPGSCPDLSCPAGLSASFSPRRIRLTATSHDASVLTALVRPAPRAIPSLDLPSSLSLLNGVIVRYTGYGINLSLAMFFCLVYVFTLHVVS